MRKINHKYSLVVLFIAISCFCGCTKFVKVEPPKSQLLGELVFEEIGTAEAALAGVYSQMRDGSNGMLYGGSMSMPVYMGKYADELISYQNLGQGYGENFYKNQLFAHTEDIYSLWNLTYNQVYYANAIVEGAERSVKMSEDQKAKVKGEALFIRCLLHFYMVNLFGDIPYVTSTDYQVNRNQSRLAVNKVYENIISDLKIAEQLLGDNYTSEGRVRPNKYVVRALMARVYLYTQDWINAEAMASLIIDHNSTYALEGDLNKVFLKESTGTIWAFQPALEGGNAEEGFTYILVSSPVPSLQSISHSLMDEFEAGDKRRQQWIGVFSENGNTWYFPYKYKIRDNTGNMITKEFPVVMRLEEQYLVRAEARAQQEKIPEAQLDLNTIRNRAGLADTDADSRTTLLNAILHERQVELFTEFGHRFFDLKRMGKADEVLGTIKQNWNPEDKLLPIPEKELLVNPKLNPQNPGYN